MAYVNPIRVKRGRTCVLQASLPGDLSEDVVTSEIRVGVNQTSELIATWDVEFVQVRNGISWFQLTLDNSVTATIAYTHGYMDFKRISGGEPLIILDDPLSVIFEGVVTA